MRTLVSGLVSVGAVGLALAAIPDAGRAADAFCGQTGPIIVGIEPLKGPIGSNAYAYSKSDSDVQDVIARNGMANTAAAGDGDMASVITAFGMPAVFSSGAVAQRLVGDIECSRAVITPLE